MGRIGSKARHLHTLLVKQGYDAELEGDFTAPRPTLATLSSDLARDALAVYRELAVRRRGRDPYPAFRPESWDLRVEGILVEFDEERHFNRYRGKTLAASAYARLPGFPLDAYRSFCAEHEVACLASASYGGNWSNRSCEAMFGPGGSPGDLTGAGAPRWRQRAYYDYLKDLAPLAKLGPMARLSVWDELPGTGVSVGMALAARVADEEVAEGVVRLLQLRASAT
jgi:hypothetical protein